MTDVQNPQSPDYFAPEETYVPLSRDEPDEQMRALEQFQEDLEKAAQDYPRISSRVVVTRYALIPD